MTILVTGATGFIGSNFINYAKNKKDINVIALSHKALDILDNTSLKKIFLAYFPEVVINFAAHRDANSAELQRGDKNGSVWKTNVEGVKNLFSICQQKKSFFVHISTDMVFSGSKSKPGPYTEDDPIETDIDNLSWYGWTKAEGERMLGKNKSTAIIRIGNVTQPIYDPKLDYVGKILYLFDHHKLYPLFYDQHLTLTYIPKIFETIEAILKQQKSGIFHVASNNLVTPYELAEYLIYNTRRKEKIKKISIEDYLQKSPNRYPKLGGLIAKDTEKKLGIDSLSWQEIVDIYIEKTKAICPLQ